ncbi:MAG TPA: aldehyde dehydrogenase family protein [Actinomycetes bacterium]|nr:aldehyde dehydrogenase family protein [Actinomycetes bacterium]
MTATHIPGAPVVHDGRLVSTNPATGEEVARVAIAGPDEVAAAVERARAAAAWWAGLGVAGRRTRLLQFRSVLANRMPELAELLHRECGKPMIDGVMETTAALAHIGWAARNARRVLGRRRARASTIAPEFSARLEYQSLGVVGAIGPWNYPAGAICVLAAYALAAGNAMVYKPSEFTPGVSQWLADRFAEVVPEQPVLQVIHGLGDTGVALCRSGVDKIAFIGSTATAKKVMVTCAETLTPVLAECGGKDAMIVAADADLDAAADAALWGGLCNAGQTCTGIERVYVASAVAEEFIDRLVTRAQKLKVGVDDDATLGPIIMPAQVDTIRRHITDGLADGGTAALGGAEAVQPPFVRPTILVDVPEGSTAVREETFGPVLVVNRVGDVEEGLARANALPYALGGSVFARRRGLELAWRMRSGMTAVNSVLSFAAMPSLPYGGVGDSGFGRMGGDDGLREFARSKAITARRAPSLLPAWTFERDPDTTARRVVTVMRLRYGRSWLLQPPSAATRFHRQR